MTSLKEQLAAILRSGPLIADEVAKQIQGGTFYLQPKALSTVYAKFNQSIQAKEEQYLLEKIKKIIYSQEAK